MKTYDLIVIGGGGGLNIASAAAALGYKAAIIEKEKLGGTCLNRGCIPSKMLIHPANVAEIIRSAKKFGFLTGKLRIDFSSLIKRISHTVDEEAASIRPNYDFYRGEAQFISNKVLLVQGQQITAKHIIIAAGARPFIPPIAGLQGTPYMTSREALRNKKLPKKLLIIGGGYIGCELGHAYGSLGSGVHFMVRGEFLQREDGEVKKEFTRVFSQRHTAHYGTVSKVSYRSKTFSVTVQQKSGQKKQVQGDALLVATGIRPNSDVLGLENTSIKTNKDGFIAVNPYLETSVPGVSAIGDIVGTYMFRHSVNFEAEYLVHHLFVEKKGKPLHYPPMPHVIFTLPEIGAVGKTEEELQQQGSAYVVGREDYQNRAQGLARLSDHGFVKLLVDKKTRKLLGAHILGEEAGTMIHQLVLAMTLNATIDDLARMITVHPALPEVIAAAVDDALGKL
ncbi:MAG: dihydrolipoyl dehydrogenase [Nanoarchaeota archaeon]|nr:dihydrolipoyl dehydrogenase [Nanoarchaeota archaeon]